MVHARTSAKRLARGDLFNGLADHLARGIRHVGGHGAFGTHDLAAAVIGVIQDVFNSHPAQTAEL